MSSNATSYLLLRVEPARQATFLTMLDLMECAEHVPIEAQAQPYFNALLSHLDSVAEHRQQQEAYMRRLQLLKMC